MASKTCAVCGMGGYWVAYDPQTKEQRCINHIGFALVPDQPMGAETGFSEGAVFAVRPSEGALCDFCHKPIMESDLAVSGTSLGLRHLGCIASACDCPCHNISRVRFVNCGCEQEHESFDPEPQPSDGPDYHAEHAAWRARNQPNGCEHEAFRPRVLGNPLANLAVRTCRKCGRTFDTESTDP